MARCPGSPYLIDAQQGETTHGPSTGECSPTLVCGEDDPDGRAARRKTGGVTAVTGPCKPLV
jgi:hypothetical protein